MVFSLPCESQVVVAGRQLGSLLNRFLKKLKSVIKFLLFQRRDTLQGQHFRLRQSGSKVAQPLEIVQFFLCGGGLTLSAQNYAEIVVGLLKIRLELDRTLERR